jgi:hypothetical protein
MEGHSENSEVLWIEMEDRPEKSEALGIRMRGHSENSEVSWIEIGGHSEYSENGGEGEGTCSAKYEVRMYSKEHLLR